MQIGKLDHVNVRTNQLDAMIGWYTDVLGMRTGARPDFPFPGARPTAAVRSAAWPSAMQRSVS